MNQDHPNAELIKSAFYEAFQKLDAETMAQCYAANIRFSDPVFTDLRGSDAASMWRMPCSRAMDFFFDLLMVSVLIIDTGESLLIASYTFSNRPPHRKNHIDAEFEFEDGKIIHHTDVLTFGKVGPPSLVLKRFCSGGSSLVQQQDQAVRVGAACAIHRKST